ncbi:D-amino-acid transaminase [Gottfriedia solisilvae]|uniref:D-alanine aminotransferase n=1 Tax=Gottfriedia solisilvae TaxID=1516104 RepID=A0A8J3AC55_9BACI|nr:D-amino-acid transaminase [Gottfriedia solisilvae]GGI10357.1 D-alanine aminotransferase [Gottfriedia solisilvae]
MKTKVLLNNRIVDLKSANVNILDRGYQFGDGVYEVVRFYDHAYFELEAHLIRLKESCEKINIPFKMHLKKLESDLVYLMNTCDYSTGYVYIQITRGVMDRNHIYRDQLDLKPQLVAYTVKEEKRPLKLMEQGITVHVTDDIRWLLCDIKSLNLLGSVLAKNKAHEKGAKEAVLHRDGIITEGSSTNVFIVKDGTLYTHPANNLILNGITRRVIIDIAKKEGIPIKETAFTIDEFLNADEAFTSSTTAEIMPIVSVLLDEKTYALGTGKRGVITQKIQDAYSDLIAKIPQNQSTL